MNLFIMRLACNNRLLFGIKCETNLKKEKNIDKKNGKKNFENKHKHFISIIN